MRHRYVFSQDEICVENRAVSREYRTLSFGNRALSLADRAFSFGFRAVSGTIGHLRAYPGFEKPRPCAVALENPLHGRLANHFVWC